MPLTVAVDFDGVVHPYTDGWQGPVPVDEPPAPGTAEGLQALITEGYQLILHSTRAATTEGSLGIIEWLDRYDLSGFFLAITDEKPKAIAYIDDRAVPFVGDWAAAAEAVSKLRPGSKA
jgi:hypothetical protein